MKPLYTFLFLAIFSPLTNAQNLVFSYTIDATIPDNIIVDIFARSTNGSEIMTGYTAVFYYDSNKADFVSYDETAAQLLGWSTAGNFTISDISRTNPNVPITHDSRIELQQIDGNLMGSSISTSLTRVGTLIFDRTVGDPNDGGEIYMGDGINTDPGIVYTDDIFDGFDIITEGMLQQSLPVELVDLQAYKQNEKNVRIEWVTESEMNAAHFIVERSTDTKSWISLGQKTARGSQLQSASYSFDDRTIAKIVTNQNTIYYRLKIVDLDGSYEYSEIKTITFSSPFVAVSIYPNPSVDELNISTQEKINRIKVTNDSGQILIDQPYNGLALNVRNLTAGRYIIICTMDTEIISKVFVKGNY